MNNRNPANLAGSHRLALDRQHGINRLAGADQGIGKGNLRGEALSTGALSDNLTRPEYELIQGGIENDRHGKREQHG